MSSIATILEAADHIERMSECHADDDMAARLRACVGDITITVTTEECMPNTTIANPTTPEERAAWQEMVNHFVPFERAEFTRAEIRTAERMLFQVDMLSRLVSDALAFYEGVIHNSTDNGGAARTDLDEKQRSALAVARENIAKIEIALARLP